MTDTNINIAAIQLEITDSGDKSDRFKAVNKILADTANRPKKADIILLPEIWGCGFFGFDNYAKEAEPLLGETFQFLSLWASRLDSFILGGSIIENDGGELFNTSILIDRKGALAGSYRKMHLWRYKSREAEILKRGQSPVVINTEFGALGLSTCYDMRFPELYRHMVDGGAEIFLVVSAWPMARLSHWRLFNQARAVENQCWLVSCNCCGSQRGTELAGHSMAVSPMGEIAAEAGSGQTVLFSELALSEVKKCRGEYPFLASRLNFNEIK